MSKFVSAPQPPNESKKGTFQVLGYIQLDKPIVIDRIQVNQWEAAGEARKAQFHKIDTFGFEDPTGTRFVMTQIDVERGTISFKKAPEKETQFAK